MNYIQYSVAKQETGNASGKAKKDAFEIALRMGFVPSYNPSDKQIVRVVQQIISMPKFFDKDVIFYQYPAVNEKIFKLFKKTVSNTAIKIALIHDLLSIQGLYDIQGNKEVKYLNFFDYIIVHNHKMESFVRKMGYSGHTIVLGLFDYLHDYSHVITNEPFSNSVSFAGNLQKATFLQELGKVDSCNWILYGVAGCVDFSSIPNIDYKGLLPSDEIQYLMGGDYGLVWDGESIETCAGPNGEYLRYNNPHKLSCCIAAGKPIITWKKAAIADFINENHIGITVDSLMELNDLDLSIGYLEMKKNVMKIKKEVAEGRFLESAINRALGLGKTR